MSTASVSNILSVTELTARIKQVLEQGFAHVQVSGEISRLTRPASGHLYFTIKDTHAAISAVVWRSTALRLNTRPEEGGKFIFTGHLSLYEPRGSYQLVVTRIEAAGAGQLAAEFERRKQLFAERGWFDPEQKRQLPRLPAHIGFVTSSTAAAFEDVKKVLKTRPAWLKMTLSPALVQGSSAPASISNAIQALVTMDNPPDLILIVRGGGSMEDLWCFNDEQLVQAIVNCPIPIISGIGHEIDTTLADYAADLRAATPSNAAELCCPSKEELKQQLPRLSSLAGLVRQQCQQAERQLKTVKQRQQHYLQRKLDGYHHISEQKSAQLQHTAHQQIKKHRASLYAMEKRLTPLQPGQQLSLRKQLWFSESHALKQAATTALQQNRQRWLLSSQRLQRQMQKLEQRRQRYALLHGQLKELNPTRVLERGYSLNYAVDGKLITRSSDLCPGDSMKVCFRDGTAHTKVESVEGNEI